MEPIHVPGPPPEAFNKNRRISDLIRSQVKHLKHLEDKLPADQRATLPQHGITTEAEAAVYIAAMTALLRGQPVVKAAAKRPTPIRATPGKPAQQGLALAAAGAKPARARKPAAPKPRAKKKSASRSKPS